MLYSELFQIAENLNSLTYFIDKSVKEISHEIKISDLKTKTENLLKIVKQNENKIRAIESLLLPIPSYQDSKYLAGSKISAVNKGHELLKKLNELNIDIANYGFISLGGGDGTELYTEIENSNINFGLLFEYDFDSVNKFERNYIPFKLKNYKRWYEINLEVIEADLLDRNKLDVAKRLIQNRSLDGIVISIQAVLHELSTRSQLKSSFISESGEINFEKFFKHLFDWHENIIIFIREPGIPENWPNEVNISIKDEYKEIFRNILDDLDRSHFKGNETPNYLTLLNEFNCKSDLAIEALTKLFYQEDYQYEKREKITSVSRAKIIKALQAGKDLYKIHTTESFFSASVQANMNKFEVTVTGENNYPLPMPQCFTYTVASKGTHKKMS
jgi:hypothetical protein